MYIQGAAVNDLEKKLLNNWLPHLQIVGRNLIPAPRDVSIPGKNHP